MPERLMAEIPSLLPELSAKSSAGSLKDLLPAVRSSAPGQVDHRRGKTLNLRPVGGPLKRCLDVIVAGTSLLLLMPLVLMIALLILISMGRPVFYAHQRVGFQRRSFGCHKFRSMVRDPDLALARHLSGNPEAQREWSETQKLRNDPRVTFVGRMLRKSSLDELPQLLNVLRGEMSCVGPRPVIPDELDRYGAKAALYLSTRPGMTGLWQVSGRSSVDYATRVALDETYVRSWSLWLDLKILFRTIFVILKFGDSA
jgi:exopolysaccharide production protein ExoY